MPYIEAPAPTLRKGFLNSSGYFGVISRQARGRTSWCLLGGGAIGMFTSCRNQEHNLSGDPQPRYWWVRKSTIYDTHRPMTRTLDLKDPRYVAYG